MCTVVILFSVKLDGDGMLIVATMSLQRSKVIGERLSRGRSPVKMLCLHARKSLQWDKVLSITNCEETDVTLHLFFFIKLRVNEMPLLFCHNLNS